LTIETCDDLESVSTSENHNVGEKQDEDSESSRRNSSVETTTTATSSSPPKRVTSDNSFPPSPHPGGLSLQAPTLNMLTSRYQSHFTGHQPGTGFYPNGDTSSSFLSSYFASGLVGQAGSGSILPNSLSLSTSPLVSSPLSGSFFKL